MNTFQRETVEHQPVTTTVNGAVVTTGVQYAVVPQGSRPTVWSAPVVVSGLPGVMVSTLPPGVYTVFVQVTANPETPVEVAGQFQIV